MPHPLFTLLAALLLAVAMAMLGDRSPRQRLRAGARIFLVSIAAVVGGGWLMYLIHG
jgi:hypothetical protein